MLAMASGGAGIVHHLLFGSVAMGIVGSTQLPVMVTGPSIQQPATGRYRLVATTDGSDASLAVVRALRPALESPAIDALLLSLSWPGEGDDRERKCRAALSRLRAELPAAHRIDEAVREAPLIEGLADMIITVSEEFNASAIAMATHGHGAGYHLLAGSVALGVVSRSPLPVILARSK
jgi:nucleotide-binding universal stress UspA family protein